MAGEQRPAAVFETDEMLAWIRRQADMGPRRPGSPAGQQNEAFLEDRLRDFGLTEVRREAIPVTHWEAEEVSLRLITGSIDTPVSVFPIPYTRFTLDEGVEGPLVMASRRSLLHTGDWSGAIVVAEIGFPPLSPKMLERFSFGVHDPDGTLAKVDHPATWVRLGWHLYRLAARKGAVGFVGILADQPGGGCEMYAPYGFKEADILDKPLPGVWVGRAEADRLQAACRSGGRARLKVQGRSTPSETSNVIGEVPGQAGEAIVLSCHHDSPFTSPVEDASGVAVVLALAKHFAQARDLNRRLVVLLTAGHFYGSIGTRTFIHEHAQDTLAETALEISIEHIAREAVEDESGRLVPSGLPEATGFFVPFNRVVTGLVLDALRNHGVDRSLLLPPEGPLGEFPPTDGGDWYAAGVPVINCISNPVYLLTSEDAIDWVDTDRLARVAGAFAEIIRAVDPLPRKEISRVDSLARLVAMKVLKKIVLAKTTFFGLKPVI